MTTGNASLAQSRFTVGRTPPSFIGETGAGGFAVIAAGISEALVATALGLGVAVVAVAFYNYFEARLERIEATLRIQAGRLGEAGDASAMAA